MSEQADIVVIGAGAAGLTAGIFAAEAAASQPTPLRMIVLDGAKTIGAKILVAGGGRCNVTHDHVTPDDYHGNRTIIRNVLAAFNEKATVRWMESIGVSLKREETGKLFPVSNSARTVLEALTHRLEALHVNLWQSCRVTEIEQLEPCSVAEVSGQKGSVAQQGERENQKPSGFAAALSQLAPRFLIRHSLGELLTRRLVLSTGGRSLPLTGSDGAGWNLARSLGHRVTDTHAALVPLVLDDVMFHAQVSGLSHEAELSTYVDGKRVDRRTGSLLWTHFGVSGPVVMDASRFWIIANDQSHSGEVRCSFVPGQSFEQIENWIIELARSRPKLSIGKALNEKLAERLCDAMLRWCAIDKSIALAQVSRDQRRKVVHALTALPLPIKRGRGWNYAEVTAGGVPLEEIDFRTMASRKTAGLYLCGEILDCDGRIGGFNFQWAWATGYLAGKGAAAGAKI